MKSPFAINLVLLLVAFIWGFGFVPQRLGMEHLKAGNAQLAEQHFDMARRIEPKTVGPDIEQGKHCESRGEFHKALEHYETAVRRNRKSLQALNNLAWLLATAPDPTIRDEKRAERIAAAAAKATRHFHPGILDTHATCLANLERWEQAIDLSRQAEAGACKLKMFNLAREIAERRARFTRHERFHQEVIP